MPDMQEGQAGRRGAWGDYYKTVETPERMMRWATTHHPMIVPLMGLQRVLETGTGTGMMSGFLARSGVEVTTIDPEQAILDLSQKFFERLGVDVTTEVGDGMKLRFEADSFDAVFSQGLWEHFSDESIRAFAREGLRLAPVVYASVPSYWYPRIGQHGPGMVGNERMMKVETWREILEPVGGNLSVSYYSDWKILTVIGVSLPYPNHVLIELRRPA